MDKKTGIIFFTVLLTLSIHAQKQLVLSNNSKSAYSIIVRPGASDIEKKAGDVLQNFFFEVTQCRLPIINKEHPSADHQIIIGPTNKLTAADVKELGEDGIFIKSVNNTIIITGGSRKGILYAVYTFLEEYIGCQAFAAKEIYLPRKNTILLPLNLFLKQIPTFSYRMTFFPEVRNLDYADWRKLNYFYEGWGLWVHSFETLLPQKEYFTSHPEYYALINEKRNPAQLDLTNPFVVKIVTENLKKLIDAQPAARYWSVSQNDNQEYCHCTNCNRINNQQESPQGALLTFVNSVAKNFPDYIITTLAYGYSEKPPKSLIAGKNVMVMLTAASITDRRKPISQSVAFTQNFKKWAKITNHLLIWDYVVQFEHSELPFPNFNTLQPNILFFASGNPAYLFEQGSGDVVGEFSELRCYIISKLMWNKNININATINKFLTAYYGEKGGTCVRKYLDFLQKKAAASKAPLYTSGNLKSAMESYLSVDQINSYKNIFKQTFTEVDINSVYGKRLSKEYVGLLYAELESLKQTMGAQALPRATEKTKMIELLNGWYQQVKSTNVEYLSEGRLRVDDYYKSYSAMLENL